MKLTDFYREILSEREPISFLTGFWINNPTAWNCAHVLAKGQNKYPKFKFYKKNVVLLTEYEHQLYDQGTIAQRQQYAEYCQQNGTKCNWQKLFDLVEELKKEYK